jgi:hypothetical protein
MTSTTHLSVVPSTRQHPGPHRTRDDIRSRPSIRSIGAFRQSAVRALLTRSITMTALAIERRIRARRRQPDSRALGPSLALWRERQAQRARHEQYLAEASAARTLFSIR